MALSDTWLKGQYNKEREKPTEKADRDGLSVRISAKGKITFQLRFRLPGQPNQQRLDLGTYPELTLAQARSQSLKYRAEIQLGNDPRVTRRLEQLSIAEANSLVALFGEWYEKYCSVRKKEHAKIKRQFEIHIFPKLGKLPVDTITLHEWLEVLEALAAVYPDTTMSILTNTKQMLKWAVKRRLLASNVLQDITANADLNLRKKQGERSLSDEEIKLVYEAMANSRMDQKNVLIIQFCLLSACRIGELRLAKKSDFDFDKRVWTVPAANHKMGKKTGKPLLRPIIDEWVPLLKQLFLLCPGELAISNADGEQFGQSFHTSFPERLNTWIKRHKNITVPPWTVHDLRKTARTNFSTLTQPHIAEIMLGHTLPGVWQTYDKHNYLDEQCHAYEKWFLRLQLIQRS